MPGFCRAPSGVLDPLFDTWKSGREIHVIYDIAYPPHSFNPGVDDLGRLRKPTRFAPILDSNNSVVPYLYGGSSLDCAIFEWMSRQRDRDHSVLLFGDRLAGELDGIGQGSAMEVDWALRESVLNAGLRAGIDLA